MHMPMRMLTLSTHRLCEEDIRLAQCRLVKLLRVQAEQPTSAVPGARCITDVLDE